MPDIGVVYQPEGVLHQGYGGYTDSFQLLTNIRKDKGRGMDRIVRLLWIIVILLIVLIVKDSLPGKATASAPMQVELVKIGGSSLIGQTLKVKVVD